MSKAQYLELASWTDSVFHIAADVRHLAPENELEKTNVKGTENVIAFSIRAKAKLFHSSTFSVSGFHSTEVLDEGTLDIGQEISQNSYIRTKYRAEEAVLKARNAIHTCVHAGRSPALLAVVPASFGTNDDECSLRPDCDFAKCSIWLSLVIYWSKVPAHYRARHNVWRSRNRILISCSHPICTNDCGQ